jgi:hypothetical protein
MDPNAPAPKLDLKMLIFPAVMFFSRKIDFKDPQVVQMCQTAFIGSKLQLL